MKCLRQAFKGSGRIFTVVLALVSIMVASVLIGSSQPALAQVEGDYRSRDGGAWNDVTNWEVYDGTEWVDATDYPGHQPGDYTVTIHSGHNMNDNNVGTLYFGDLIIYGRLSLNHYLTLDSTDHLLVDGYYFDGNDTLTGGAIYWEANVRLSLPVDATLDVRNIKDEYDQVVEGLGLYSPHAANNNMRLRIGNVDYASATGEGNVICTFDMINEAGGSLAVIATADPAELEYDSSLLTTELTCNATGFGSDPAEATLSFYWTGTGPGSFTFNSSAQNPGVVDLDAGGVTYAGNYTFTLTVTSTDIDTGFTYSTSEYPIVTINPAPLTTTGITGVNKIYDGTTAAEVDSTGAALVGVITDDDVDVDASGAMATFGDKSVGSGKTVRVMGLSLTGADVGNYTLIQPTTTADITPKELTVTGITSANKIYDGTTAAEMDSTGAVLVGVIPPDDVALDASGATATFGDKNAGSGKTVTVMGLSLTGADVGNYTLIQPTTTADITPKELTITANSCSKTYGDTVTFAGTEFEVTGLVDADTVDSVTLTSDGAAATAAVGTHAIVPSEAVGTGLENYDINYVDGILTVKAGGGGLPWWAILLIALAAVVVVYFAVRYIRKKRRAQSY